jgi:hypothetical protein
MRAFDVLTAKDLRVHLACCVVMLQGELSLGVRPGARTRIRYVLGSYDLGRHAATPFSATGLVRQRPSDQGQNGSLSLGFLDSSVSERQPLPWPGP